MSWPKSATQPYCRMCGKAIRKRTSFMWVRHAPKGVQSNTLYLEDDKYPKNRDDCQKLTNLKVIAVQYSPVYGPDLKWGESNVVGREVTSFTTWDGESYVDLDFCNGNCRSDFAYMMAAAYPTVVSKKAAQAARERAEKLKEKGRENDLRRRA